jgi:methylated-DNA-protein-cysteine methyltransferase-like protein
MIHRVLTRVAGKGNLLTLLRTIPSGRVTTFDMLAEELGQPAALVQLLLSALTEDEREIAPWHRVVAKGGAIGRGPHRDQQFARLIREGILVSPAGIVQDMPRFLVTTFEAASPVQQRPPEIPPDVSPPGHRSRGMKSRP